MVFSRFCSPLAVALLLLAGAAAAQQVYRSIDADGNVTFSSSPPPPNSGERVDTITLPPGPTPAQQAAAEERMRQIEADAQRRTEERASRQAQQQTDVQGAREVLRQAEADLLQAQERGEGDWQTLATGGRVPSASFNERVQQAEQRVQEARDALNRAQQGGR